MRTVRMLVLSAVVFALLPAASASAGRLLVTGHDADYHCQGGSQCHFVEVATNYVRGGAPDPAKPVLVLDRADFDFPQALDNAFPGGIPRVVMEPQSAAFAAEPLTPDRYSAILIASDTSCGGCDLNPGGSEGETADSDAINARKGDIEAFFNAGGGIYANAGAEHGNGTDPDDVFYNFVPIPVGGVEVQGPFCLTPEGAFLGFEDPVVGGDCPDMSRRTGDTDDINCCATHNSFTEPDPTTALKVAERDTGDDGVVSSDDSPETLYAEGIISGGRIITPPPPPPPTTPAARVDRSAPRVAVAGVTTRGCRRRAFNARFRINESNLASVSVFLDGRRVARTTRKVFSVRVPANRLRAGRHRLRVVATDRSGNRRTVSRAFARCAQARPVFTG